MDSVLRPYSVLQPHSVQVSISVAGMAVPLGGEQVTLEGHWAPGPAVNIDIQAQVDHGSWLALDVDGPLRFPELTVVAQCASTKRTFGYSVPFELTEGTWHASSNYAIDGTMLGGAMGISVFVVTASQGSNAIRHPKTQHVVWESNGSVVLEGSGAIVDICLGELINSYWSVEVDLPAHLGDDWNFFEWNNVVRITVNEVRLAEIEESTSLQVLLMAEAIVETLRAIAAIDGGIEFVLAQQEPGSFVSECKMYLQALQEFAGVTVDEVRDDLVHGAPDAKWFTQSIVHGIMPQRNTAA